MGRLIVLSGPSCVGKGPLCAAIKKFYPDLLSGHESIVLYNSRSPRPAETDGIDYHFRSREEVVKLAERADFIVMDVRGDLQAVDIEAIKRALESSDLFFEGNPFIGEKLLALGREISSNSIGVFLSPLSSDEIRYLRGQGADIQKMLTDVMRRKLLRRTQSQKGLLSLRDLEEIERRAGSAYNELKLAPQFDFVIPNHDGEDSENWSAFYYPIADARKTTEAFAPLLMGKSREYVEKWNDDLFT